MKFKAGDIVQETFDNHKLVEIVSLEPDYMEPYYYLAKEIETGQTLWITEGRASFAYNLFKEGPKKPAHPLTNIFQ